VVHLLARVVLDAARDEVEQRERVPLVGALLGVGLCPVRAPAAGAGLSAPPGLRADRGAHFAPPFSASIIPIVFVYCAASRLAVLSSLAAFAVPQALCEATVLGRPASSPGSSSAARSTSRRAFAAKSSRVATACRQASITLSRYCAAECSAKRSVASVFVVSLVVCASIFASVCGASECARSSDMRACSGREGKAKTSNFNALRLRARIRGVTSLALGACGPEYGRRCPELRIKAPGSAGQSANGPPSGSGSAPSSGRGARSW